MKRAFGEIYHQQSELSALARCARQRKRRATAAAAAAGQWPELCMQPWHERDAAADAPRYSIGVRFDGDRRLCALQVAFGGGGAGAADMCWLRECDDDLRCEVGARNACAVDVIGAVFVCLLRAAPGDAARADMLVQRVLRTDARVSLRVLDCMRLCVVLARAAHAVAALGDTALWVARDWAAAQAVASAQHSALAAFVRAEIAAIVRIACRPLQSDLRYRLPDHGESLADAFVHTVWARMFDCREPLLLSSLAFPLIGAPPGDDDDDADVKRYGSAVEIFELVMNTYRSLLP